MKSIKDIKKEIGYISFTQSKTDYVVIPIYSINITKNGINIETEKHYLIKQLNKMSNFHDDKNILLCGEKIEYSISIFKNHRKSIDFNEVKRGFLIDLVVSKNTYLFTLTK